MENSTCVVNNVTLSRTSVFLYATVASVESLLIIISNLLILVSISKFRHLRIITSNILIANLAVSDILMGLILLPVNTACVIFPHMTDSKYSCTLKIFIWMLVFGSGLMGILIVSIDRFFAICTPLEYKTTNKTPATVVACSSSWILWIFTSVFACIVFNSWDCSKLCTAANVIHKTAFQLVVFILFMALFISCVSFLIILYKLVNSRNRSITLGLKRRTKLMVLVYGVFVLFLIPLVIGAALASTIHVPKNRMLLEWLMLLCAMNSLVNGLIYGVKRPEFRKAYWAILSCTSQNRVQPTQPGLWASSSSRRLG